MSTQIRWKSNTILENALTRQAKVDPFSSDSTVGSSPQFLTSRSSQKPLLVEIEFSVFVDPKPLRVLLEKAIDIKAKDAREIITSLEVHVTVFFQASCSVTY